MEERNRNIEEQTSEEEICTGYACERCGKVPDRDMIYDFHIYSGVDPRIDEATLCDECAENLWPHSGWSRKGLIEYSKGVDK